MTWVKVEDDFLEHPKAIGLTDEAIALWLRGLLYASHYLTDGHVPEALALRFSTDLAAAELVQARLWEPCMIRAEWRIVNYEQYQRSAEEVVRQKESGRARTRRWRDGMRDASVTRHVSVSDASVTRPEVEVEVEKETPKRARAKTDSQKGARTAPTRGTPVPDPFEITPAMKEWGEANAWWIDLERETDRLVDWAKGKGELKRDWPATWRNWMRRRADEQPKPDWEPLR